MAKVKKSGAKDITQKHNKKFSRKKAHFKSKIKLHCRKRPVESVALGNDPDCSAATDGNSSIVNKNFSRFKSSKMFASTPKKHQFIDAQKNMRNRKKRRIAARQLGSLTPRESKTSGLSFRNKKALETITIEDSDINSSNTLKTNQENEFIISLSDTIPDSKTEGSLHQKENNNPFFYDTGKGVYTIQTSALKNSSIISEGTNKTVQQQHDDDDLEEGEILSQMNNISVHNKNDESNGSDDDCVFVETPKEIIVIDDEESQMENTKRFKHNSSNSSNQFKQQSPKLENAAKASSSKESKGDDNTVIILDDTICETPANWLYADFVPLSSTKKSKNTAEKKENIQTRHSVLTREEEVSFNKYSTNIYNANKTTEKTKKRLVIVDGSNVAFGHSRNRDFSVQGIQIAIDFFVKRGHDVIAVVPQFRTNPTRSSDPEKLKKMRDEGIVMYTPCKNLPGASSSSYDDRFIIQLACELDAAVISNDNYRDLLKENSAFEKIIKNRVVGYTFFKDIFILPMDPYGRFGPTLQQILER